MSFTASRPKQKGFSLVELSIVIVIIGLIVSSVLVGQDLVRGAEIRALVADYERFNQAGATFRERFNGLPGDRRTSGTYGFGAAATEGTLSTNGVSEDGILQDLNDAQADNSGEFVMFWNQLAESDLLAGAYNGLAIDSEDLSDTLPQAKGGGYWGTFSDGTDNYYIHGATYNGADDTYATTDIISPRDLSNLEQKIDDNRPGRGIVRARDGHATAPLTAADSAGTDACTDAATPAAYDLDIETQTCTFTILFRI